MYSPAVVVILLIVYAMRISSGGKGDKWTVDRNQQGSKKGSHIN
jgi:hypothetical protein